MVFYIYAFWIIFADNYANIVKIDVNTPPVSPI